jgi:hypothetical protein
VATRRTPSSRGSRGTEELLLIGVDGGASEVKAHEVLVLGAGSDLVLGLGAASASCCYDLAPGFAPVAIEEQLDAFERDEIQLTAIEREQGRLWIDAAARSITAITGETSRPVLVGMCMPGLKTRDKRGIAVARNGPRIPDFLDRLEERLVRDGLALAAPIADLLGDGEASGLGENVEMHGALRDVADAYYIGGGTGVAEVLKLGGRIVAFDELRESLPKAWQLESAIGRNFESLISMRGINATYAERTGRPAPVDRSEFPEERALAGDSAAVEVLAEAAEALAELVHLRLCALQGGAAGRGHLLERVVLGQQLARLFSTPELASVFRAHVEIALARRVFESDDPALSARVLDGAGLAHGFLRASGLRAAPAIGAAATALRDRAGHETGRTAAEAAG